MKMKKITIASIAIGTMLSVTACSPSAEKDQVKKEQTNAQEEAKTTNADETSATKNDEKETNTSTNEKTEKDQKNSKESSGTESNAKTTNEKTKEKETNTKANDQTTGGKTTEKETSTKTTEQSTNGKTATKDTNKSVAVKTNVKAVAQLIDSLDKQLAANPKLDTVNKLGKQINEKWDVIEKELEATHPTDYKTIGQSMYPLIVAAEKEKIDMKRIKSLTTKTKQDLNQLLNKL
ncbi:hypothetical protein AAIE21_13290 [Paenibacillus sp. 102]|uniref:hypothetical protein n=1 Tax=Paenibacillus sp. 102 TaxID=3120823 RepID=UPI0031BB4307